MRKIPGEGVLPLAEMIAPVLAAHPDLPVGLEVISDVLDARPTAEAAQALFESLRPVMARAAALNGLET